MTLSELKEAIEVLLEQGVDPEEPLAVEYYGSRLEVNSIAVVVQSDLWVPETVVMTVDLMDEGEADDG